MPTKIQQLKSSKIPRLRFPGFKGEWEEKKLGEVAPLQRGFDLPVSNIIEGEYPVVFSNGILKFHNEFKVTAPGVVTGRSGSIGKVNYIEKNYWPHNTSLWVTDFKGNFPKYIFYFYSKYNLERFGTGSGVPTLNRNNIHDQKEFFPHFLEQQKIADFLSEIDKYIENLRLQKDNIESYKKGMMHKIFSQEIRFKDDKGKEFPEWEEKRLEEVATFLKGKGIFKEDIVKDGENKCIRSGELYTQYNEMIKEIVSCTNYSKQEAVLSENNDILMPTSDLTPNGLATASALSESGIIIGGDIQIMRSKKILNIFFSYYVQAHRRDIMRLVSGVTVYHIYGSDLKKLRIFLPSLSEQQKIATFLTSLDKVIESKQEQIVQAEKWKKGLIRGLFV